MHHDPSSVDHLPSAARLRSRAGWIATLLASVLVAGVAAGWLSAAEPAVEPIPEPRAVVALKGALVTNLNYCDDWLKSNDFKTLGQTATGLKLVVDALAGHSSAAEWQAALTPVVAGATALEGAARSRNAEACREQIAALRALCAKLPLVSQPATPSKRKPAASSRSMMDLLEGTLADAKTAAIVGNGADARSHAQVLAELGRVMSNYRNDPNWQKWNDAFIAASQAAADAPADQDLAQFRALLKTVSQRCDACHDHR